MKRFIFATVIFGGLFFAYQANAAVDDVCFVVERPTKNTDGTTLPASTSLIYKVYRGESGKPKVFIAQSAALTFCIPKQPAGIQCYELTAVDATGESPHTNQACKIVRFPGPSDGKIESPSDGAIEDK